MTVVVVVLEPLSADPLPRLVETAPLDGAEARVLYRSMVKDTLHAVATSQGDLLVNYPSPERTEGDPEEAARELAAEVESVTDARFEVQVGSSFAARVGNAVTHLLDREGANTAAAVPGTAPLLERTVVDSAAMRLRRRGVVLGPDDRGGVYYAGFAEPIQFSEAYAPPAVESLARRAADAGHDVGFLRQLTTVATGRDLAAVIANVRAREAAGRPVPEHTAATVAALDLYVEYEDGEPGVGRA
ncbi:MAG: DUF2064 domain-containing protein [Halobacteriaceae archaeon]